MNGIKEQALALHGQGYNCAQSVLMALDRHTGLDAKSAASVAAGFGGGAGCRELCGAVSGALMAAGMKYGAENRMQVNAAGRELVSAFREKFGALRCADLKANRIPCDDLIAFAAEKMDLLLGE